MPRVCTRPSPQTGPGARSGGRTPEALATSPAALCLSSADTPRPDPAPPLRWLWALGLPGACWAQSGEARERRSATQAVAK